MSVLYGLGWVLSRHIIDRPLLVVGAGRSGTKALRESLQHHPYIVNADGEAPFIAQASRLIDPFEHWPNRDYLRRALKFSPDDLHRRLRALCFEAAMGPHLGARRLAREVIREKKPPARWKHWCAKTFPDEVEARCLKVLFPSLRFIYIVRNGYEVVNSRMHWPGMKHLSFQEQCQAWASAVARLSYLDGHPSAHTVRHEDFLQDPDAVFRRLFEWLGLPCDERPASFARTTLSHPLGDRGSVAADPVSALAARPPPYEHWTDGQRDTFHELCGDAMEVSGYKVPF